MEIDWEEIWKVHSPYYKDGKFELTLENGEKVLFKPGAAFGDGSHPTTNLVLSYLPSAVKGRVVVDLGSGSGVLSMAAAKLGAKKVYALEIDGPSIEAMKVNLKLNLLTDISINERAKDFEVVLLNMISSEQKIALKSHPYLLKKGVTFLVSGVLHKEIDAVLESFGSPKVTKVVQDGEWVLLEFTL